MTGKHVKEEIKCGSRPCSFSEYARGSCDFFVEWINSKNPGYILEQNNKLQQVLCIQRA